MASDLDQKIDFAFFGFWESKVNENFLFTITDIKGMCNVLHNLNYQDKNIYALLLFGPTLVHFRLHLFCILYIFFIFNNILADFKEAAKLKHF